jgi:hypothetical protein
LWRQHQAGRRPTCSRPDWSENEIQIKSPALGTSAASPRFAADGRAPIRFAMDVLRFDLLEQFFESVGSLARLQQQAAVNTRHLQFGAFSELELDFKGVYRLSKDGTLTLLTKEMTYPNGIALSPDEKTLYVANSDPKKAIWMSFPINQGGTLGKGKVFADYTTTLGTKGKTADGQPAMQLPDGLKVDVKGNIWATGPGGLLVFTPAGKHIGTLATGVNTGNCCFGDDGSTLYVMCDHAIARIKTKTKGLGF